jgi:citrate lyase subunit beta-like protein
MNPIQVPSSSTRMLEKSLKCNSDTLIYDLEDSVAPSQKESARTSLINFLAVGIQYAVDNVVIMTNFLEQPRSSEITNFRTDIC